MAEDSIMIQSARDRLDGQTAVYCNTCKCWVRTDDLYINGTHDNDIGEHKVWEMPAKGGAGS